MSNDGLKEYNDSKRLAVYKMLTDACSHLFSKGKLQQDKFNAAASVFADLAKNDPLFLAHFTAWSMRQDSKDQKVLSIFFNALSDADGSPIFKGAELNKPNLRQVSHALVQRLDVPLATRVAELGSVKFSVPGLLNEARHFPTAMKTALRKFILFRELNHEALKGIRNAGLTQRFKRLYRVVGLSPSDYAVGILKWNQKDGRRWKDHQIEEESLPDFNNLSSNDIVEVLSKIKLSPLVALSVIPKKKITASVASALMDNCSGNQLIALYGWFSENGFLDVKSIRDLFKGKVKEATTAVDRIDTLTRDAVAEDKDMLATVRSDHRKKKANTSKFGKVFMHLDTSGSMNEAIKLAKEKASIFAECVENPEKDFSWASFTTCMKKLPKPINFRKEGFHQALYGILAGGGTDCFACYAEARKFGANVDVFITDEEHNMKDFGSLVKNYHEKNPNHPKPNAVIIVRFGTVNRLENGFQENGIPVVVMKPEALSESALVAQSVATAIKGEMATIEEIMETPLPVLPSWWNSVERVKHEQQTVKA